MTPPREAFESWVKSRHRASPTPDLRRDPQGYYVDRDVELMWTAFAAGFKTYEEGWKP